MGWLRCAAVLLCAAVCALAGGNVFILSAPSGTGKSTVARELVARVPGLFLAVSHTTRAPRPGEREGVDYFFVEDAAFDALVRGGRFLEWTEIYGHRYGLDRAWVEAQLASGRDLLLDLETTTARTVRQALPGAVSLFLAPPSAQELARRLRGRGTETEEQIALRLGRARLELSRFQEYDFLVINATVKEACRELEAVVLATRARRGRREEAFRSILAGF